MNEDEEKLLERTRMELYELMEKEKVDEYIKKVNYNLLDLQMKLFLLRLKNSIKNNPMLFTIIGIIIIALIINWIAQIKLWW
jgi:hypothetical protein